MTTDIFKPLSSALTEPILKAYKAGGFGVAFLLLGAILMLAAFVRGVQDIFGYAILGVGIALIAGSCVLFYYSDIRPLRQAQAGIVANRELVDGIQGTALELSELASELQSLAFKHATAIADTLKTLRPQIRMIPVFGTALADSEVVTRADALSASIVNVTGAAKAVIVDVRESLVTCNIEHLKKYSAELMEVRKKVSTLLSARADIA